MPPMRLPLPLRPALFLLLLPAAACVGSDDDAPDPDPGRPVVRPETTITEAPAAVTNDPVARFVLASTVAG